VKICDFGVSKIIKKDQEINEACGTPAYLAPEIIKEKGYSGFGVDIWSLGILLYAMLNVSVPFEGESMEELNENILKGEFTHRAELSEEAQDLL